MSDAGLTQARQGDAEAFAALAAPLEGMVYRHCLQMLRNPADAQDAAQEAMLRAYRAFGRFRGQSGMATWLFRIAHNVCLDALKRPRAQREGPSLEQLQEAGFEPADADPTPEERYLAQSERERLTGALLRLPIQQQALLSLRFGEGLGYDELAQALGLNPGTVKSRLSRAREKLRALLDAR